MYHPDQLLAEITFISQKFLCIPGPSQQGIIYNILASLSVSGNLRTPHTHTHTRTAKIAVWVQNYKAQTPYEKLMVPAARFLDGKRQTRYKRVYNTSIHVFLVIYKFMQQECEHQFHTYCSCSTHLIIYNHCEGIHIYIAGKYYWPITGMPQHTRHIGTNRRLA